MEKLFFQEKTKVILNELNGLSFNDSLQLLSVVEAILLNKSHNNAIDTNDEDIKLLINSQFDSLSIDKNGKLVRMKVSSNPHT